MLQCVAPTCAGRPAHGVPDACGTRGRSFIPLGLCSSSCHGLAAVQAALASPGASRHALLGTP
eukprot:4278-Pelagomonas_calceolata.AAC.1